MTLVVYAFVYKSANYITKLSTSRSGLFRPQGNANGQPIFRVVVVNQAFAITAEQMDIPTGLFGAGRKAPAELNGATAGGQIAANHAGKQMPADLAVAATPVAQFGVAVVILDIRIVITFDFERIVFLVFRNPVPGLQQNDVVFTFIESNGKQLVPAARLGNP